MQVLQALLCLLSLFASVTVQAAPRPVVPSGDRQVATKAPADIVSDGEAQTTPPTLIQPPVVASPSPSVAPAATAPASTPAATADDYRLGVSDKVRVIVFNEPTLSGEFTVSDVGTLSLPLIGDVQAGGRSQREVTKDIEAKLADGYLREPRVSIDVLTYRPFYILGEVTKPGEYPFSNGLNAINAIARAEGFTYRANKKKVWIRRAGETEERAYRLNAEVRVYPGDTVRIGERFF